MKYRIWNKITKEFDPYMGLYQDGQMYFFDLNDMVMLNLGNPEDFIVSRSTGLTDKNNVDIYEGDIIKYTDKLVNIYSGTFTGEYTTKTLEITYLSNEACFSCDGFSNIGMSQETASTCYEVIGNIYDV